MNGTGRLTEEQERRRIEGLRTLARIIARHRLARPDLYGDDSATKAVEPAADGESVARRRDAA